MKKLLFIILIIEIINLSITVLSLKKVYVKVQQYEDTIINRLLIDSIQFKIIEKESIIFKIKEHEKDIDNAVNALSDSSSLELFKMLVSDSI